MNTVNIYSVALDIDRRMICGKPIADTEKRSLSTILLSARSTPSQASRFYEGVHFPGNIDKAGRRMYPEFFIPPYNGGKKLQSVLGQTPKTHIFSANMYELDILRLLSSLSPGDPKVTGMTARTVDRLRTACFAAEDDGVGECFDTGLVALRFLAACAPGETEWMRRRIDSFHHRYREKKRPWYPLWYYWLCLSELPDELALPEISLYRDEVLARISKSCVMNSERDRTVHPVLLCILRNMLARLSEYAHIKTYQPYIDPRDGRLRFDIDKSKSEQCCAD